MKMKEKLYHTLYLAVRILCANWVARACLEVVYHVLFGSAGQCWTEPFRSCCWCRAAECWTLKVVADERGRPREPSKGVSHLSSSWARCPWSLSRRWACWGSTSRTTAADRSGTGTSCSLSTKWSSPSSPRTGCAADCGWSSGSSDAPTPFHSQWRKFSSGSHWSAALAPRRSTATSRCRIRGHIFASDCCAPSTLSTDLTWLAERLWDGTFWTLEEEWGKSLQMHSTKSHCTHNGNTKGGEMNIFWSQSASLNRQRQCPIVGSDQEAKQFNQNTFEQVDNYLLSFLEIFLLYNIARRPNAPSRFAIWIGI